MVPVAVAYELSNKSAAQTKRFNQCSVNNNSNNNNDTKSSNNTSNDESQCPHHIRKSVKTSETSTIKSTTSTATSIIESTSTRR
jgi:secreted trypsin-like serine protease